MMDVSNTDRPARRTALIARELNRYNVDIAALAETRLADEGSLTEVDGGYTFYWKGLPEAERRIYGVGFAVRNNINKTLPQSPVGISERLMKLRLPLTNGRFATLFSCYAPTLNGSEETKDIFYESLDEQLGRVPASDKTIVLGDFNARVGSINIAWPGVLGPHGLGNMNANGHRLLTFCAQNLLTITNTNFQMNDIYKGTWKHPRSNHWHTLDYILVRQRDRADVCITRAMRGAECWTDHRLLRSTMKIRIRPPVRKGAPSKKLNCSKLNQQTARTDYVAALNRKLDPLPSVPADGISVESGWESLAQAVLTSAEEVLGFQSKRGRDWFDENADNLGAILDAKHKAYLAHISSPSSARLKEIWIEKRSQSQRILRQTENQWWLNKASELQRYADKNDMRNFYDALKQIYGPTNRSLVPVRAAEGGALLVDKCDILNRWEEHYDNLLNTNNPCDPTVLDQVPDFPDIAELDIEPTIDEVGLALKSLKRYKSPGLDRIPGELLMWGGDELLHRLHDLIIAVWHREDIPQQWKDSRIISIYKNKGDRSDCGNSRGISLLSVAGKVLAKVLLDRLNKYVVDEVCPETQCGFRKQRGTVDMIFLARQIQEKAREQNRDLCIAFIDLRKAFDSVNRSLLWTVMRKFGCPRKFVAVVRAFHENMTASVSVGGEETNRFKVEVGVKQGCVLAPVIFNLFLAAATILFRQRMIRGDGVGLTYRLDGSVFDLRRLKARTKVKYEEINELQYADDCALIADDPQALQASLNCLAEVYGSLGLVINADKTEVLYQMNGYQQEIAGDPPELTVNDIPLKTVTNFKYLGSVISNDATLDEEIFSRIGGASGAFAKIRKNVINNHDLQIQTKSAVYRAVCLSTLLYGSESWTLYRRHVKKLEHFHIQCVRRILGVSWRDRIPHTDLLNRVGLVSIECMLLQSQLRWAGHVLRMPDNRLPRQVMYGQLTRGTRTVGAPKKRWKDTLAMSLRSFSIEPHRFEEAAGDRGSWRQVCRRGSELFEAERSRQRAERRARQREAAQRPMGGEFSLACAECGRLCGSRIGLISHSRTHLPRR